MDGTLLVVQTYEVAPLGGPNYFEIHLAADTGADAPKTIVFTWSHRLYALALKVEGGPARVRATWTRLLRPLPPRNTNRWIRELDTLEPVEEL